MFVVHGAFDLARQSLHLIYAETDGVEILAESATLTTVFLHEADQEGATVLPVKGLVIHFLQLDGKLGVGREGGCRG